MKPLRWLLALSTLLIGLGTLAPAPASAQAIGGAGTPGLPAGWASLKAAGIDDTAGLTVGTSAFGAVDSGPAIQTILNNNKLVIWDVACGSATTLKIPSGVVIWALPSKGCVVQNNLNSTLFANTTPTFGLGTPVVQTTGTPATPGGYGNAHIKILGGIWIGNEAGQSNPSHDYPASNPPNCPLNFVRFAGVQDVEIANAEVLNFGGFNFWIFNFDRVHIHDCHADTSPWLNTGTDIVHFNGPGQRAVVERCIFKDADDTLALNGDDGGSNGGGMGGFNNLYPVPAPGSLTDITFRDITFDNTQRTLCRILSVKSPVDQVRFENFRGSAGAICHAEIFAGLWLSGNGAIGRVYWSNIDVQVTGVHFDQPAGWYIGLISDLWSFREITRHNWLQTWNTITVSSGTTATVIGRISIDGVNEYDTSGSGPLIGVSRTVNDLSVANVNLKYAAQVVNPIGFDGTSNVGTFRMKGFRADKCDEVLLTLTGSTVGPIAAENIVHTGSTGTVSFVLGSTVPRLSVSNWYGAGASVFDNTHVFSGTTPTQRSGDAFVASF